MLIDFAKSRTIEPAVLLHMVGIVDDQKEEKSHVVDVYHMTNVVNVKFCTSRRVCFSLSISIVSKIPRAQLTLKSG